MAKPRNNAGDDVVFSKRCEKLSKPAFGLRSQAETAQLGLEASGEIDAVGSGVTGPRVGDAVSVIATFGYTQYGLYGDLVLAPARSVVKHPANLSWEEAAASWMPFTTAWTGLIDPAKLTSKDTVLITAASSGVGLAAIQVTRREGAIPIALTRRSRKADALLQAGAAHVIATEEKDVEEEVERLTGAKGATSVVLQRTPVSTITRASTLSRATFFRDSRPVHSSPGSRRRFPSNASSTLTAISSQTNSSGKSSSPFSVLSSAVSKDEEMPGGQSTDLTVSYWIQRRNFFLRHAGAVLRLWY
jgi:hypothetical protein